MIDSVKEKFDDITFIGVVEDVNDPETMGRIKIRVEQFHGRKKASQFIDTEDLPWASPSIDLAGGSFSIPPVGKVVYVNFTEGDVNRPNYSSSVHYNYNLQRKLATLGDKYSDFYAVAFDDQHQYYHDRDEGVMFDYVKTYTNLRPNGDMIHALRDNSAHMFVGSPDASEQAVLGNHWMNFMDHLINVLLGSKGGPYLGNLGAPVIAAPSLIEVCQEYFTDRPKYLSDHITLVDNNRVKANKRKFDEKVYADKFNTEAEVKTTAPKTVNPTGYQPKERKPGAEVCVVVHPSTYSDQLSSSKLPPVPTQPELMRLAKPFGENFKNGSLPISMLTQSKYAKNSLCNDDRSYLLNEAAISLDSMLDKFHKQKAPSLPDVVVTKAYNSKERQVNIKEQYSAAPVVGGDPFGWGNQVELYFGAKPTDAQAMRYVINDGKPTNPLEATLSLLIKTGKENHWRLVGRDSNAEQQWWHWIYDPTEVPSKPIKASYTTPSKNKSYTSYYYVGQVGVEHLKVVTTDVPKKEEPSKELHITDIPTQESRE